MPPATPTPIPIARVSEPELKDGLLVAPEAKAVEGVVVGSIIDSDAEVLRMVDVDVEDEDEDEEVEVVELGFAKCLWAPDDRVSV
jgi:hypothetical protein